MRARVERTASVVVVGITVEVRIGIALFQESSDVSLKLCAKEISMTWFLSKSSPQERSQLAPIVGGAQARQLVPTTAPNRQPA